jgi:hypothetical protein
VLVAFIGCLSVVAHQDAGAFGSGFKIWLSTVGKTFCLYVIIVMHSFNLFNILDESCEKYVFN